MGKLKRSIGFASLLVFVFFLGNLGGIALDRKASASADLPAPQSTPASSNLNINLINQAWQDIQNAYVDRPAVQTQTLTYGAISGMVNALGDTGHTSFLTPEMVKSMNMQIQGAFDGVGLYITQTNNQEVITAPIPNSPAEKAGLKPGEIILKVNGVDISGMTQDEVISRVIGPAGTQVTLTILDPTTNKTTDYTLTRARIVIPNLAWSMVPGTTYADIAIASFSNNLNQNLIQAIKAIQEQHATAIILDLRNNPGGLVDQAIAVASQFKASGLVMEEKDSQGKITPDPVRSGGLATKIPVVLVVNKGTASAAEIVTVALQDNHRSTVVGETTIGTGTVLSSMPLSDGSEILLATAEWLTPGGASFWHKGVAPDIQVSLAAGVAPLTPDKIKAMSAAQLKASPDAQLLKAIDVLNSAIK